LPLKKLLQENNITINGLWIGSELSKLELLCIESFVGNGHKFNLWAYDDISTPIPAGVELMDARQILPAESIFRYKYRNQFGHGKGSLGGFSDLFRYKLLYEKGGWWVDMDVCCLKTFDFPDAYVFRTHQHLKLVGNIIKCPPKSALMKSCFERTKKEVDENNRDWHKPIQILIDEVYKYNLQEHIKEFSNPDSWRYIRKLLSGKQNVPPQWYAIHWVNEEWRRNQITKNYWMPQSHIALLMEKHGIKPDFFSIDEKRKLKRNLSYFTSVIRQIPFIFKAYLRKLLFIR